ncbi:hypothetical protein BS17DRAFT_798524 [Gyrodon lividus]|nr:hypothetical protein BS17DRAFT_798524 [Gyrodon lividus]
MCAACLQKDWTSPVYAFFNPIPTIHEIDGRCVHEFACSARGCKVKVHWYLNTKDARSTGNMRKHIKLCWGTKVLDAADNAKDASKWTGSIVAAFEWKGKGKITYNRGFLCFMKTGRPEYYLPLPNTVLRDTKQVFAQTHVCIARMLQEYHGWLNFTTDTWTSPNHHSYVAICVHLQHKGSPMSFPLDVVELAKSHTSTALANAFEGVLNDFGITDKVDHINKWFTKF